MRLPALLSMLLAITLLGEVGAAASPPPTPGPLRIDAGLLVAPPVALPTGLATGITAGVARGGLLEWGARISWASATESSLAWTVTHQDLRLRATAAVAHAFGRGTIALRLGAGGTLVHEDRVRNQGKRAGLSGSALETTAWTLLPAADLELEVVLHVTPAWSMTVTGGPSLHLLDGGVTAGWVGGLGVAWQP